MRKLFIITTILLSVLNSNAQKKSKETILVGKIEVTDIQTGSFNDWYKPNYENYQSNSKTIDELKSKSAPYTITVFMGTWCEDSHINIPNFFKVMDQIGFDKSKITLIAVDKNKKTKEGFENKINIFKVPTFIIYKDGEEINRIVESPVESFEKDLLKIFTGQNYIHQYAY